MKRGRIMCGAVTGAALLIGACGGETCEPRMDLYCDSGRLYWVDSCGEIGAVKEECPCGCLPDRSACESCGCLDHADCDASSVCQDGDCLPAYGRRYRIVVESVDVSDYDQNGEAWDWPGGMPDPFVCVYRNKTDIVYGTTVAELCTAARADTFHATFGEWVEAELRVQDRWTFLALDEDIAAHDVIGGVYWEPIPVSAIRAGGMSWRGTYLRQIDIGLVPVR